MKDLHILQHSLGLDQYGRGTPYRNHFVTGPESDDYPVCMDLVERGLMIRKVGSAISGGDDIFSVTNSGRDYVAANSPKAPKLSRSKQRYQDYLDLDSGMTFFEYLKWVSRRKASCPCSSSCLKARSWAS